jgi:hypothetical protein
MKEIKAQQVLDAYKTTGLKPVRNDYGDEITCGCPVVALWIAAGRPAQFNDIPTVPVHAGDWLIGEYGQAYATGFLNGIDGLDTGHKFDNQVEYRRGRNDGLATAEALVFA